MWYALGKSFLKLVVYEPGVAAAILLLVLACRVSLELQASIGYLLSFEECGRLPEGVSRDLIRRGGGHAESPGCLLMVARGAEWWGVPPLCTLARYAPAFPCVPGSNFDFQIRSNLSSSFSCTVLVLPPCSACAHGEGPAFIEL